MVKTVSCDGLSVAYIEQGEGADLLLLHGWGARAETYRLLIDHLAQKYRVIAPDLPGFGDSEEPKEAFSVDDYADFVLHFCEAAGVCDPVVMGHSNGGRILIKLLSREPAPLNVKKAVLLDSAGVKPKHGVDWYVKVYSYKAAKKLLPGLAKKMQGKVGSTDYKAASPVMRQAMVKAVNEDLTDCLPKITASTLLIWGELDDATPLSDGKLMEKKIPDAGLVTLAGAGHFAFAERWAQCRAVLDAFL